MLKTKKKTMILILSVLSIILTIVIGYFLITTVNSKPKTSKTGWNNPAVGPKIFGIQANGTIIEQKSSNWDTIIPTMPGMKISNNQWGLGKNGSGYGSIFSEKVGDTTAYGWAWDWNSPKNQVVSYQEIGWGWSPNAGAWFNGETPMYKISDNKTYTVSVDTKRTNRSGVWNTAFDIWMYPEKTYTTQGSAGKNGYELMVWLDHEVQGPWGSNPQEVTINGIHWKVYDNDGAAGWRVISYINQDAPITSLKDFNMSNMWNDAVTRYSEPTANIPGLSKDYYINAIEFGSESCGGQGMFEFKNYKIDIR